MQWIKKNMPGVLLSLLIAVIAFFLGNQIPLVGGPVFALGLGMLFSLIFQTKESLIPGLQLISKKGLKFAIILLGFGLSMKEILMVGKMSLIVMLFTLTAAFGFGYLLGRLFKMNWKLSSLISAGTGICGGSAIAALAPVIDAEDSDILYAISATFIFDIIMIVLFPLMGHQLGLTDLAYGLWAGTAVNDTSSVVAAGYSYSNIAGNFATIVKLTRTLSIIPTIITFSYITQRIEHKKNSSSTVTTILPSGKKPSFISIVPYFILFFLLAALLNSIGFVPSGIGLLLKKCSKFMMIMALAAIGIKTDFNHLKKAGMAPLLHGFLISGIVVIVSLGLILVIQ